MRPSGVSTPSISWACARSWETSSATSVRLPWHDTGWTGTICRAPAQNTCFILGRELLYTALTRQQNKVVLLVQGKASDLRTYSGPRYSEVARRYTNLFRKPDMLDDGDGLFLEKGLIHRTDRGELVRSISEVVVANALHSEGIDYSYERALRGHDGMDRYPDFTVVDRITDQTVFWEHLGML